MFAKEEGVPVDAAALDARVRERRRRDRRASQAEAGVDIINDGEMSKPSYATYVKDRLNGFGGTATASSSRTWSIFPRPPERVFGDPGRKRARRPAATAPIEVQRPRLAENRRREYGSARAKGAKTAGAFSSAASPGVISLFFRNDYYKSHEDYLYAIAEAMRYEYETIANAGMTLQLDCPDLAMGRHVQYCRSRPEGIPQEACGCISRR